MSFWLVLSTLLLANGANFTYNPLATMAGESYWERRGKAIDFWVNNPNFGLPDDDKVDETSSTGARNVPGRWGEPVTATEAGSTEGSPVFGVEHTVFDRHPDVKQFLEEFLVDIDRQRAENTELIRSAGEGAIKRSLARIDEYQARLRQKGQQ